MREKVARFVIYGVKGNTMSCGRLWRENSSCKFLTVSIICISSDISVDWGSHWGEVQTSDMMGIHYRLPLVLEYLSIIEGTPEHLLGYYCTVSA